MYEVCLMAALRRRGDAVVVVVVVVVVLSHGMYVMYSHQFVCARLGGIYKLLGVAAVSCIQSQSFRRSRMQRGVEIKRETGTRRPVSPSRERKNASPAAVARDCVSYCFPLAFPVGRREEDPRSRGGGHGWTLVPPGASTTYQSRKYRTLDLVFMGVVPANSRGRRASGWEEGGGGGKGEDG